MARLSGARARRGDGPPRSQASLSHRMVVVAAVWISLLLAGGGFALDRVLSAAITRGFDQNLEYILLAMIRTSEIDEAGEVRLREPLGDQRFLEAYSGLYWQISGRGHDPFPSRSLWDRTLATDRRHRGEEIDRYFSRQFAEEGELRVLERDVVLPGSATVWRYQVAQTRTALDDQIGVLRRTMVPSFVILGLGLMALAALQTVYGLWPLRSLRDAIMGLRMGSQPRLDIDMPREVAPLVEELNALLAHTDQQAEAARLHAGNLAHALKTPLTVITAAADAGAADLADTVVREAATMRRQVDHHLARARAVGRRGAAQLAADVGRGLDGVFRAVGRMHPDARLDRLLPAPAFVRVEPQDLDELLGNLIENAAKYGGGSVFVTVERAGADATAGRTGGGVDGAGDVVDILIEDDGPGIPPEARARIFDRGVRLDSGLPGSGLGLAIVRDVAELYGGSVTLGDSEDLGGLLVTLTLPAAAAPVAATPPPAPDPGAISRPPAP